MAGTVAGTMAATDPQGKFLSLAHQYTTDREILETLEEIERDFFVVTKSTANAAKWGVTISPTQVTVLEKYHASTALKSGTSFKLAQKHQKRLLREVLQQLEQLFHKKRKREEMIQEQREYEREQAALMDAQLQLSKKKFLRARQQDRAVLDFVLDREANESDEDFNVFDQRAKGLGEEQVSKLLRSTFAAKVQEVADQVAAEAGTQEKLEYFISENNLEAVLKKAMHVPPPRELSFKKTERDELRASQQDFTKNLSTNYYDEQLAVNQAEPKNALIFSIQKEIAEMSKKLLLVSPAHEAAL